MNKTALLSATLTLFVCQATAGIRHYSAEIANSNWQVTQNSPLQCTLRHDIPRYGKAEFTSKANRELNMLFELDMLRLPDHYSLAEIRSVAPAWKPGQQDKTLTNEKIYKQFNIGVDKKMSWSMLNELDKGMTPTIYYADWYSADEQIAVALSTAKFRQAYDQFVGCIGNLLDYSFDDIAYTVLNYKKNSDELTKDSRKRLQMIQQYLSYDQDMELVVIDGYADSYGGRWHNEQMSKKRAEHIKKYFTDSGVELSRIETNGLGEKRHIASNNTILGREKNRRVIIQMEKP